MSTALGGTRPKTDAKLQEDAERLHSALSELVRVYQFRDRDRICCHDVSVTQCYALEALLHRGPSSLNELAAQLFLDKSTASRVVGTLERKGYLTRSIDPQDRRAVSLEVTAAGRRLHDRIRQDLVEETRRLLEDFEPEVREAAPTLLRRLARSAANRAGLGSAEGCCPPKDCS